MRRPPPRPSPGGPAVSPRGPSGHAGIPHSPQPSLASTSGHADTPHSPPPSLASTPTLPLRLRLATHSSRCRSHRSTVPSLLPQIMCYPFLVLPILLLLLLLGEHGQGLAEGAHGQAPRKGEPGHKGRDRADSKGQAEAAWADPAGASRRRVEARIQRQGTRARALHVRSLSATSPCPLLPVYNTSGKVIRDKSGQPLVLQDWSSWADTSSFRAGPCLTVSAIHLVQTPLRTVLAIDREDPAGYGSPGAGGGGGPPPSGRKAFFAEELNLATGAQRALNVARNAFCSTGTLMPDGSLLSLGGFQQGIEYARSFQPCTDSSCDFELLGKLNTGRWYPSSQLLGNGRVLIVGGQYRSASLNSRAVNSPSVEYWPPGREGLVDFPFLTRTLPFNQYPILHLLPSGLVFIFAGQEYTLFNTTSNKEVPRPGGYPALRLKDGKGRPIFRCSPSSAASALLPLSPTNGYKAEVIICGGPRGSFSTQGQQQLETADDKCWRIFPDSDSESDAGSPKWVGDRMCYDYPRCAAPAPRVMGQAVILADGSLLILSGARMGFAGYRTPGPPNLQPILYFPANGSWYTQPLAASYVPRLYHSTALLLHDATVLVAGSGPNVVDNTSRLYYPTESRTELFHPPYLQAGPSPSLSSVPSSVPINRLFSICFQSGQSRSRTSNFKFALSFPGFSTHGRSHGMRHIHLEVVAIASQGGGAYGATLRSPPSLNIAPPTSYWLFVLELGVPTREGRALRITPPLQKSTDQTFPLSKCHKRQ